jgi:hypothetical protein
MLQVYPASMCHDECDPEYDPAYRQQLVVYVVMSVIGCPCFDRHKLAEYGNLSGDERSFGSLLKPE